MNKSLWKIVQAAAVLALTLGLAFRGLPFGGGHTAPAKRLPPTRDKVSDFVLTDQLGRRVTKASLREKVWVAYFFYTSCQEACPLLTVEGRWIARKLSDEPDFRMVGFTTDPRRDKPDVLRRFGKRARLSHKKWWLLTGERGQIRAIAGTSFGLGFRDPQVNTSTHAGHGSLFALVDGEGSIRGYYRSDDHGAVERLERDARTLLASRR